MLKGHHRSTPCWCEEALDGSVPRALLTKQRPQRVHGATHLHSVRASCWGRRLIFHCSAKIKMSVCNNFDDGGAQHPKRHTHCHRMHSANQPRDAQNRVDTVSWPGICSLLCFKYHARPERHSRAVSPIQSLIQSGCSEAGLAALRLEVADLSAEVALAAELCAVPLGMRSRATAVALRWIGALRCQMADLLAVITGFPPTAAAAAHCALSSTVAVAAAGPASLASCSASLEPARSRAL